MATNWDLFKPAPVVKLPTLADVNDVGKPWRYEEEGYTVTRSSVWSPPGCHPVGCGVKLYVDEEGRLEKVEGDENNPVTQGRLCPRCIALKDYVYNPARILHPMKRDPKDRGKADKWEQCSMDEAFAIIKENYERITGEYGLESMVTFSGTGREGGTMATYITMVFPTCNGCYTQSGYACYTPRLTATVYMTGTMYSEWDYAGALPGRWDDERYEMTEVIMLWGKSPLESNPDGFFGHSLIDAMRRGSRVITIDPRVNWTSTRADEHVQLRAGTDTALGMAMLNVIIEEELYDKNFVDCWCYGFEELAERVKEMPPEKAAEICGVPAEQIYKVARMYATAKPAAILWGLAVDQKQNGMQNGQVIIALQAITGNLDRPGGQLMPGAGAGFSNLVRNPGVDHLTKDLRDKTIGLAEYPAYVSVIGNAHADTMLQALETGEPYPLKMGFYMGNNLLACTSMEPKRWHDAIIKSLEFCFTVDCFMNPSVEATCDLILPLSTVAEREGTVFTHYAPRTVTAGFMHQAITVDECRSDLEYVYELGKHIQPQWWTEFDNVREWIEHLRLSVNEHGKFFEKSAESVVSQIPIEYFKYEKGLMREDGLPGFSTPTGRVELWCTAYDQFGEDPLPYYTEPPFSPVSTPELMDDYPYVLTTGARNTAFFHSEHRQIAYLRELHPDPIVEINPITAAKLGIQEGMWVRIWNMFGECVEKAHISPVVNATTVHADHGWWFPEEDGDEPNLYGTFRSNINNLIPNFYTGKLGFGAPGKCMICNIEPAGKNYDTDMSEIWEKFGELV